MCKPTWFGRSFPSHAKRHGQPNIIKKDEIIWFVPMHAIINEVDGTHILALFFKQIYVSFGPYDWILLDD